MFSLLAQVGFGGWLLLGQVGGWGLEKIILTILIVGGAVAILLIALRAMGVAMPQWVWQILMVIAVVIVAAIAIRFIFTL
jgi:hypothetical protein